jgi:hypothetical protein
MKVIEARCKTMVCEARSVVLSLPAKAVPTEKKATSKNK